MVTIIHVFFFCQSVLNGNTVYVFIQEQHEATCNQKTNQLLKKENDDLTEKYMRMAMSHFITCLIQEHIQKAEMTISGLKERIADLEQKVT